MHADASPAEIAASLTKAQLKRLEGIYQLNRKGLRWASAHGDISLHTSRATSQVLLDLGLITSLPMTSDGCLTPLGLAVRAILMEQANER